MKIFKRFFSLPMILLALIFILGACGGNGSAETGATSAPPAANPGTSGNATPSEPAEQQPSARDAALPPDRDLGGMEIIIANWWSEYETDTADPSTFAGRERLEDRRMLEKKYNFKIKEIRYGSWGDQRNDHPLKLATKSRDVHIWILEPNWYATVALRGLLAPIPMKHFTEGVGGTMQWHQETMDWIKMFSDDDSYMLGFTQGFGESAGGVYYNKRLFEEAGLDRELPYTLQAEGKWTWDEFTRIARLLSRDIDGDGITDTWALATFHADFLPRAIFSNNASVVGIDPATGRFFNNSQTPEFYEALAWVVSLREEGLAMHEMDIGGEWNYFVEYFNNGHAAMRVGGSYVAGAEINPNLKDDWGFVAFPKGPRADNYYTSMTQNLMCIPGAFTPEEVDDIMFAFTLWNRPLGLDEEGSDDDWMFEQYPNFRDTRAVEETMALYTRNKALQRTPYNALVPGGFEMGDGFAYRVWTGETDAQTILEEIQLVWNETLARANEALGLD